MRFWRPAIFRERVWLEPRAGGFIVCRSGDSEPLTVSPITFYAAEKIAREYAERVGATVEPKPRAASCDKAPTAGKRSG